MFTQANLEGHKYNAVVIHHERKVIQCNVKKIWRRKKKICHAILKDTFAGQ